MSDGALHNVKDVLEGLAGLRVLVVGDVMMDTYRWGEVQRVSPEAPVPVVRVRREEQRLGGAANVVHNLVALSCKVGICALVGQDAMGSTLSQRLKEMGVSRAGLLVDKGRPTTEKVRIMAQQQQMLRYDWEDTQAPTPAMMARLLRFLKRQAPRYAGVIVSDYGKGMITPAVMELLIQGEGMPPVFVDPKGADYGKYRGVACLTPNAAEAAQASGVNTTDEKGVLKAAQTLSRRLRLGRLCITRGAEGVLALERGRERQLRAQAREVFDVTGAGDTFISVSAALYFSGQPFFQCVETANLAAGVVVGKLGTAVVTRHEISSAVKHRPNIHTAAEIGTLAASLHAQSRRIVFTNGCFDLLHAGHIKYLQASRALGDMLVVGINSDASVARLKGPERPVLGEEDRAYLLGALACVDHVIIFAEDTPLKLIRQLRPHVLTKGADYTVEKVVGHKEMARWGGEVRLIPLLQNRSTTDLIQTIRGR